MRPVVGLAEFVADAAGVPTLDLCRQIRHIGLG